ncbi:hypothetical protein [Variovorax sp. Sphag1AA]|uniref:hypothetical protein n=1 Tax=Variovorax sp. Sphag1AA TaxID=2587027 RepID=UPI001618A7E4|nr:hypothetical protein [Variovorax sp. Sphag1AA]MBB3182210.1 hypothetical protein [Variovorax sp. Sphag1AA]
MSASVLADASLPDAPEVLRRLLALIDTLHQPQDLTTDRVARFTGFTMRPFSEKPTNDAYQIFQPLTDAWRYLYIWGLNSATRLPDLGLTFIETDKHSTQRPSKADICQFDAMHFHDALLKMGYRHVGNARRESAAKQYRRGLVEVDIGIVGESSDSFEKISHGCVKRVSIGFLENETLAVSQ